MAKYVLLALLGCIALASADFLMGGHLDNKNIQAAEDTAPSSHLVMAQSAEDDLDLIAEESSASGASTPYPDQEPRYKFPYAYAFNGGKPFSLEKDPITGKIDLQKAPPLKPLELNETYVEDEEDQEGEMLNDDTARIDTQHYGKGVISTNSKGERVGPNDINPYSPSFHDFLNLPVKYSSEKYEREKYPLISSSYANTKVQSGSNSYQVNNHRPTYHQETATKVSISTATRKIYYPKPTTSSTSTTTTTTTTTKKPETTSTSTTTTTTTMKPRTTVSTTTTTRTTTQKPTTTMSTTRVPIVTANTQQPPSMRPRVTTYKPSKSTSRYDEYEEMLPIEKLQGTKYGNKDKFGNDQKEVNGHNNGPQSPLNRPTTHHPASYDYSDGYEDYEIAPEDRPIPHPDIQRTTTLGTSSTATRTSTTMMSSTSTTPSTPVTYLSSSTFPASNIHLTTKMQPPPVTSMPLDTASTHLLPPVHENFVEVHKQPENIFGGNSVHFSGAGMYPRPGSVISVLPESTSNVIVPHDQDTVSFVLGNRQNVEGSYYTHGSEEPPHTFPQPDPNFRPMFGSDQKVSVALPSVVAVDSGPPKWYKPEGELMKPGSPFVFPAEVSQSDAPAPPKDAEVSGFVTFPEKPLQDKDQRPVEEHIIVINQADGSIKEMITPAVGSNVPVENPIVFNNDNLNLNPNLPQLSESLTPPAEPIRQPQGGISQRPPYYFNYQHGPGPIGPNNQPRPPQRIPLPPRQKPDQLPPVGFKRRPPVHPQDVKLPNILPQFRPNAKTSHGHRGTDKIGTLPAPPQYANRPRPQTQSSHGPHHHQTQSPHGPHPHPSRRPPMPHSHQAQQPPNSAPPHFQRLSPPPPPNHPHPSHAPQILRKKEDVLLPTPTPEQQGKRYRPNSGPPPPRPVAQKLRMEDDVDRFSAEPPQVPPRPIIFPKSRGDNQAPVKVATLQMIKQRGAVDDGLIRSNLPPLFKINKLEDKETDKDDNSTLADDADRRKDGSDSDRNAEGGSEAGPVYVVYPVSSGVNIGSQEDLVERDESVVIGTRGPHRPLPPDTLLQDDEEDKNEDDKLSGYLYGKRPHHNAVNSDFNSQGYPHEPSLLVRDKPVLVHSENAEDSQKKTEESNSSDSSFNVISYLQDFLPFGKKSPSPSSTISATLPRQPLLQSSSPIAYVYTPTTPASDDEDDVDPRQKNQQDKPVLLPSQQPSSSSSSAPSPQNFMAPFVASVSAEMPVKNGWSVVVNATEKVANKEAQDKKDLDNSASAENEAQTEKADFDPDTFKPQLYGGFKPIYEFPVQEDEQTMTGRKTLDNVNVNADAGRRFRL